MSRWIQDCEELWTQLQDKCRYLLNVNVYEDRVIAMTACSTHDEMADLWDYYEACGIAPEEGECETYKLMGAKGRFTLGAAHKPNQ